MEPVLDLVVGLLRLIPRRVRRRLYYVLPLAQQLRLGRFMILLMAGRRSHDRHGTARVKVGGQRARADVAEASTPSSARQRNLDAVVGLLEQTGIPYFCLPTKSMRSAVLVEDTYYPQVQQALMDGPVREGACAQPVNGQKSRWRRREKSDLSVFFPVVGQQGRWILGKRIRMRDPVLAAGR